MRARADLGPERGICEFKDDLHSMARLVRVVSAEIGREGGGLCADEGNRRRGGVAWLDFSRRRDAAREPPGIWMVCWTEVRRRAA